MMSQGPVLKHVSSDLTLHTATNANLTQIEQYDGIGHNQTCTLYLHAICDVKDTLVKHKQQLCGCVKMWLRWNISACVFTT